MFQSPVPKWTDLCQAECPSASVMCRHMGWREYGRRVQWEKEPQRDQGEGGEPAFLQIDTKEIYEYLTFSPPHLPQHSA